MDEFDFDGVGRFDGLDDEARSLLASSVRMKTYRRGQQHELAYWDKSLALLVEGLMVLLDPDDDGEGRSAATLACPGRFITMGRDVAVGQEMQCTVLCITDCRIALFDNAACEHLYWNNPSYLRMLLQEAADAWEDANRKLRCARVVDGVRYVLDFCNRHGIGQLTHEQIGAASGHARQAVTRAMRELLAKDPGLFEGIG